MGGFVLYDCKHNFLRTLAEDDLGELDKRGMIDWPKTSEKEIRDRSKADMFSKGFAVLQTAWFIIQCISRGAAKLSITELEIVTLAFAILNIITYWLWWDKPFDARCPVPIYLKTEYDLDEDWNETSLQEAYAKNQASKEKAHTISRPVAQDVGSQAINQPIPNTELPVIALLPTADDPLQPTFVPLESAGASPHDHDKRISNTALSLENCEATFAEKSDLDEMGLTATILYKFIWNPIKTAFTPLSNMFSSDSIPKHDRSHVPTFFSPPDYNGEVYTYAVMIGIIIIFGAIHCIPWAFKFPTPSEGRLWMISAFTITWAPFLIPFMMMLSGVLIASDALIPSIVSIFVMLVTFSLVLGYIVSRILLLVLPLVLLRDLPTSALVELRWSQVFPHI